MITVEKRFITVVSGLPRSGTSMMMQMLEVGGLPTVTDSIRRADDDNPGGYYEFEAVKQLKTDTSWLVNAYNKAVKVIYLLLYNLPPDYNYKVIFMRRTIEEVIASQKVMLQRLYKKGGSLNDQELANAFRNDIEKLHIWIKKQDNFTLLYVNYDDVLYDSEKTIKEINHFLGYGLDTDAMVRVIDRSLHRQRL